MFKKIEEEKISKRDEKLIKYWMKNKILTKSIEQNKDYFVFYDGPATANGMPGVHHLMAKMLKDSVCKYQTMKGKKVLRKVGWDAHGLPVEVEVEKTLGFSGKEDIEKYGVKKFNKKCKESVLKNEEAFKDVTLKMGQFIDLENPYITYHNSYIETEWWILKEMFEKGYIYDGFKIVPYCPRCGTGLASHEVAQGYKEIDVNTVTVPFKMKGEDTYFLVWTTTPWTLIANVALCLNPSAKYQKVKSKGYNFIVAESLASKILGDDFEVLETYEGKDLEYKEYEQLIPFIKPNKKAFYVTLGDYVTTEDGTGIVHIAPAFGEDDYQIGQKYDLPFINCVDKEGKYNEGLWKGKFVLDKDLEIDIIKYLKENDKLFKKEKMKHNYPHCWRCHTPLIYYAKSSLYFKTTLLKDRLIEANKKVNWYPSYTGEKRFNNWLENSVDWAISRNRYWGTPIPLWRCSCGYQEMIGSIKELKEKSLKKIDDIDLHRPFVDEIEIECPKCHKVMTRIKDVIDCWFDSGSMPFAQYHYPFENKELFLKQYPADFISEGIDQTRGWFYSLLIISVFLFDKAPYKNVLVNDLLLDKDGQKMSKTRGNAIDPFSLLEEYGADAIRWYMLTSSPIWLPLKFDVTGVKEVSSKFFNTLKNTYNFFQIYANIDKIDKKMFTIKYDDLEELDKWILASYNTLLEKVDQEMKVYNLYKATKLINTFLVDDFSNWYIRRTRDRFWQGEINKVKISVYQTTYQVLVGLTKLVAPFAPFLADLIYQNLTGEESVHLAHLDKVNKNYIDEKLLEKMDLLREFITLGRTLRDEKQIKVRQPLSKAIIDKKYEDELKELIYLIKEELNVKEIVFENNLDKYMTLEVVPNFKVVGPILGKKIGEFKKLISTFNNKKIEELEKGELTIRLDNEEFKVTPDLVELRIKAKGEYDVSTANNKYLVLDTLITKSLEEEGLARELINKIQNMRKDEDFNIASYIEIYYETSSPLLKEVIDKLGNLIKRETLANIIKEKKIDKESIKVNNEEIKLKLKELK